MSISHDWRFPLLRTHQGMLLGNGQLGAMIWGEGRTLKITVGRADAWDRRGGRVWTDAMSYHDIRDCLAAGREKELNRRFAGDPKARNPRPSVLPIGRFEFECDRGTLELGRLDMVSGVCRIRVREGRHVHSIELVMDMDQPVLAMRRSAGLGFRRIRRVPAWSYPPVKESLLARGFSPPRRFSRGAVQGWVQPVPADPSIAAAVRSDASDVFLAVALASDPSAARRNTEALLSEASYPTLARGAKRWWRNDGRGRGAIRIPNERLQFLYDYGMYKFRALTAYTDRRAIPATLQGPWIEEYQMPPWSSDYHFNINVQMCYWPAFHGNAIRRLRPLFDMLHGWTETLRHNAEKFIGVDDGRLLPHAVSDEGKFISSYWAHSVDHGSTAWMAHMMFRYYRYTLDRDFLQTIAWPFMTGAMAVYEAMLEERDGEYRLEIGVSPEYFTPDGRGYGPNASFQLACIHRLADDLVQAAAALGKDEKPCWRDYLERLPRACVETHRGKPMIMLWENQALEESHRHHSHLGGIVPFDRFDPDREDETWRAILVNSMDHWMFKGMGLWSGWCVPWAAMLYTRFNCGRPAEMLLETWQHVFTNAGHGTLHDADIPGLTRMGISLAAAPAPTGRDPAAERIKPEVMQMDAGMGVVAAIQEMLLHTRQGINYVMAGVPEHWREAAFENFLTDGGFELDATRCDGALSEIVVRSPKGGEFRLANPWRGRVTVSINEEAPRIVGGRILTLKTRLGDRLCLRAHAQSG